MEKVDLIDTHDNLTGSLDLSEVHKKKLLHRGISVLVFNASGDVFIQQRSESKELYPLAYECSISGHVKQGETYHQAALRELREELSLNLAGGKVKEVSRFWLSAQDERMFVALFIVKDLKIEPKTDPEEAVVGEFWDIEKLEEEFKKGKISFHPCAKKSFELFRELDGKTVEYISCGKRAKTKRNP